MNIESKFKDDSSSIIFVTSSNIFINLNNKFIGNIGYGKNKLI